MGGSPEFSHSLTGSSTANLWDNLEVVFSEPLSEDGDDNSEEEGMVKPEDQPACLTADEPMADGLGVWQPTKKVRKKIITAVPTSSNDGAHNAETIVFTASGMMGMLADQCPTKSSLGKKAYQCSHCKKSWGNYQSICNHIRWEHLSVAVSCFYCKDQCS